jgi:hypothetical protein
MSDEQNRSGQEPQEQGGPRGGNDQPGGIGGIGQVNVPGNASFGGDFHDNSATNNVEGTQNNVQGSQYNAGQDQFIGNRNISTGSGGINDYGGVQGGVHNYGGVQGGVNSGSGSQTNIRAGDISNNQGNVAVGSGINQSYSAGEGQAADPQARTLSSALLELSNSLFDRQDISNEERNQVRGTLKTAIQSLRSRKIDANVVGGAMVDALYALGGVSADTRKEQQMLRAAADQAGLDIG